MGLCLYILLFRNRSRTEWNMPKKIWSSSRDRLSLATCSLPINRISYDVSYDVCRTFLFSVQLRRFVEHCDLNCQKNCLYRLNTEVPLKKKKRLETWGKTSLKNIYHCHCTKNVSNCCMPPVWFHSLVTLRCEEVSEGIEGDTLFTEERKKAMQKLWSSLHARRS